MSCKWERVKFQLLLYMVNPKSLKMVLMKERLLKKAKIIKRAHHFKNHAHTYAHTVEISNSFNPELQLKNTEFASKNKLKRLLNN